MADTHFYVQSADTQQGEVLRNHLSPSRIREFLTLDTYGKQPDMSEHCADMFLSRPHALVVRVFVRLKSSVCTCIALSLDGAIRHMLTTNRLAAVC
jgi:hypothetical protein